MYIFGLGRPSAFTSTTPERVKIVLLFRRWLDLSCLRSRFLFDSYLARPGRKMRANLIKSSSLTLSQKLCQRNQEGNYLFVRCRFSVIFIEKKEQIFI